MRDMLVNNFNFEDNKPNLQVRLSDWANGEDGPFYWRHLLGILVFSIIAGLILPFFLGISSDELLPIPNNILGLILLLFISLVLGVGFLFATQSLLISYFWYHSNAAGRNDNSKSIKYTLEVIKHSRSWMVLYDYGENQEGNIYSSSAVQDALLAKLDDSDKGFKISMIFKKDKQEVDELPLIKALKQWQKNNQNPNKQVEILCGKDRSDKMYQPFNLECNGFPDHYKINDAGYAYLTTHAETVARRKFLYYEPASGWYSERVSDCLGFHNSVLANG